MRIYVDQAVHRWRGQLWCHMFSPDLDALHAFAASIGMKRAWFQDPDTTKSSWPHYDVNANRRAVAVAAGAVEVGRQQTSAMSKVVINRWRGLEGTPQEIDPLGLHRRINSSHLERVERWLASELATLDRLRLQHASGIPQESMG